MHKNRLIRAALFLSAWLAFVAGVVGIFVPVLPTTPFLLLASFLFAKSSMRFHTWMANTGVYRRYVVPFKERGGLPLGQKLRILVVSFGVMAISAVMVPLIYVWLVLGAVAVWLIILMFIRIPTVPKAETQ